MPGKVLVDTSVWIDFFRTARAKNEIESLLSTKRACYCGLIATELIRGSRGKNELNALEELFQVLTYFAETNDIFYRAGRLGNLLALNGANMAVVDLVIAQICIENKIAIFTYDKHFDRIAQAAPLKIYNR